MRSAASWPFVPILSVGFLVVVSASVGWSQTPAPAPPPANTTTGSAGQQAPPSESGSHIPTGAQEPISPEPTANDQGSMFVFKKQVEEVVLHATVYDE